MTLWAYEVVFLTYSFLIFISGANLTATKSEFQLWLVEIRRGRGIEEISLLTQTEVLARKGIIFIVKNHQRFALLPFRR